MTAPAEFIRAFSQYIQDAKKARENDMSEKHRQEVFLSFLHDAFGLEANAIERERFIFQAHVKRKGYLDALFGDLIFEFKRKLEDTTAARDREQLLDYLVSLAHERDYVGVLTDSLTFEVFALQDGNLKMLDRFELKEDDPETAYVRLDAYLFSQKHVPPTSADVVGRFGSSSPTFQLAFHTLNELYDRASAFPALKIWREQWDKLLSKVYGSKVGDVDLFLRHTYLCQFAKLLAYAALRGLPDDEPTIEDILSGKAFYGQGVSNIGENDFFSWVLLPEIKAQSVALFRRLALGLVVYDLSRIDQDLLKQLYQNLVDPATRHQLGEFYTPDWLAELTLQDIDYHYPQSLLDPACGSGSFLFATIKRLAAAGLTGWPLVRFTTENIIGMDVHPLAVTIARINYLLALSEHLRTAPTDSDSGLVAVPVYMADALIRPLENEAHDSLTVPVDDRHKDELFYIPFTAASAPNALTEVIEKMHDFARSSPQSIPSTAYSNAFRQIVIKQFGSDEPTVLNRWNGNLNLLTQLIHEKRNGIWAYILKNLSRPLVLAKRQFDVVAGNPPWLRYSDIKSKAYQAQVKMLYQFYKLIESNDNKLFTAMDLSTLFYVHALDRYLKPGGTLAFVMPRAVITGAKQHRPFQMQGFSRVIDLLGVEPLFNMPTCVLVRQGDDVKINAIPSIHYIGKLSAHEINLEHALPMLTSKVETVKFVDSDVRSPYYYDRFQQGATLVPRNLCFVKPEGNASSPAVITDPEADKEAKKPYKGIKLRGVVENDYVYATLLSKHLVPFGYEKLHMVALPAQLGDDGTLRILKTEGDFAEKGHFGSWDWFAKAAAQWNALKKESTHLSFTDQLNYRNKITMQNPSGIKVFYNSSGTHISACVIDILHVDMDVHKRRTKGFIADYKTYSCQVDSLEEAHYLCALLNAPSVDTAIKVYQTRGIYKGERDISRTPLEACAIPQFDPTNADHCELARLSQEAHARIETLKQMGLKGDVYRIRAAARKEAQEEITAIDILARRVIGLA